MASILEQIPGVGDVMDRWFSADDAAGITFGKIKYLTLDKYEVFLPVTLTVGLSTKEPVGAQNKSSQGGRPVVQVVKDITIRGKVGNWRYTMMPPVPAIPMVGGVVSGVAGVVGTLLGTDKLVDKREMLKELYTIFLKQEPIEVKDVEGLVELGITHAVPERFEIPEYTAGAASIDWEMKLSTESDLEQELELFNQEKEAT